jgi:hypothetical protein
MESTLEIRILLPADQEAVMAYARQRLEKAESEPMDIEMKTWVARWRGESLAYYLPQGWSFGVFNQGKLRGFLLGQPFLFFRGLTQTLWIEELQFETPAGGELLLETAYKWARDKHLQCVLLENRADRKPLVEKWKHAHQGDEPMIELRSSRF